MRPGGLVAVAIVGLVFCWAPVPGRAQEPEPVTLAEIADDPAAWRGRRIVVEGDVTEISQLEPGAVFFRLTDAAGRFLWVQRPTEDQHDHPALYQATRAVGLLQRNVGSTIPEAEVVLVEEVAAPAADPQAPLQQRLAALVREPAVLIVLTLFGLLVLSLLSYFWWSRRRVPVVVAEADTGNRPIASLITDLWSSEGEEEPKPPPRQDDTPLYTDREIGRRDVPTPVYLGRLVVKDCIDESLIDREYDLEIPPGRSEAALGRGSDADILIEFGYLSRRQLLIEQGDDELTAQRPRGSKKVEVDGRAIREEESFRLESGVLLTMQGIALLVELD